MTNTTGDALKARAAQLLPCPFCGDAVDFEHSYREDSHKYPRDFWHVRIECCKADTGWWRYGEQEHYEVPAETKADIETRIAASWNTRAALPVEQAPQPVAVETHTSLSILIEKSKERLAVMSEEERTAMWQAQRESFARAMSTPCEHGELDFEQCRDCRAPTEAPPVESQAAEIRAKALEEAAKVAEAFATQRKAMLEVEHEVNAKFQGDATVDEFVPIIARSIASSLRALAAEGSAE